MWETLNTAVKLALEKWRHWLEGSSQPFLVLTDHKNLENLHTAKRLNPRQSRWALFFTRFNFTWSYRPESKNGKADALSCLDSTWNYIISCVLGKHSCMGVWQGIWGYSKGLLWVEYEQNSFSTLSNQAKSHALSRRVDPNPSYPRNYYRNSDCWWVV